MAGSELKFKEMNHYVWRKYLEAWNDGKRSVWYVSYLCQIFFIPEFPKMKLANISVNTDIFYVRTNKSLFYVDKVKEFKKDLEIEPNKLKEFDLQMKLSELSLGKFRFLTDEELDNITLITGHNIYKEERIPKLKTSNKLACIKNFYIAKEVVLEDLEIFNQCVNMQHENAKKINLPFIEYIKKDIYSDPECIENFHQERENELNKYIDKIRKRDIDFYNIPLHRYILNKLLRIQMFRTFKPDLYNDESLKPWQWALLSIILVHAMPANQHLILLINETNTPFITGDQPVINLYYEKYKRPKDYLDNEIKLYYPVSPQIAILLEIKSDETFSKEVYLNEKEVENYNNQFIKQSKQIFSNSKESIENAISNKFS